VETQTDSESGSARQAASDVKQEAAHQGSQLKETATEHAGALAGQAKEQARNVLDDTRVELQRHADIQGRRLGQSLGSAGHQLHSMAAAGEPGLLKDMVHQLADGLSRVADTIDRGGIEALTDDIRTFARRQPGAFLFGAAAAGFATARLLRFGADVTTPDSESHHTNGRFAKSPVAQETVGSPLGPEVGPLTGEVGGTVGFGSSMPTGPVLDDPGDGATTGLTP